MDNLLKRRRKYKLFVKQTASFVSLVRNGITSAKRKEMQEQIKEEAESNVEDLVFYKVLQRERKLNQRWEPYLSIVKKTEPVIYVIRDQMPG